MNLQATDFLGRPLKVGDIVAHTVTVRRFSELRAGTITQIEPVMHRDGTVEYLNITVDPKDHPKHREWRSPKAVRRFGNELILVQSI
jgi:hypothetical protein